jgi:L-alanine-DL-glutamate epimerase-like enolase superfamily enzyme
MWRDDLGAGLQMAMFDLAGKLAGVPIHALLGEQVRTHCPISYWHHDASPATYEGQARRAVELGYSSIKIKTRPWWDVRETVERISAATPDWFSIDCDWNDLLIDEATAAPVLLELERDFPKIKVFEGPIRIDDVAGNRSLRARLRTPTAHH